MRLALLFVAAVIAILAGVFALRFTSAPTQPATAQAPAEAPVQTVDVILAKEPITAGTIIDETMIDKQPWPAHLVAESFIVADGKQESVIGKIARANFEAREPLLASKLAKPGDPGFMAGALPAGSRAVTMAVDAVSGVAGYVLPGDRVDVLLTHNIQEQNMRPSAFTPQRRAGGNTPGITEVLMANVPVLAVNIRPTANKEERNNTPSTITLQVEEQGPQQLRLAEKLGTVSLALRSLQDRTAENLPPAALRNQLSKVSLMENDPMSGEFVRVVRGAGRSGATTELYEMLRLANPGAAPLPPGVMNIPSMP